jgi:hypothetical protein
LNEIILQFGMAGAVIIVVGYFLKFLEKTQEKQNAALMKMAEAIDRLSERVDKCPIK